MSEWIDLVIDSDFYDLYYIINEAYEFLNSRFELNEECFGNVVCDVEMNAYDIVRGCGGNSGLTDYICTDEIILWYIVEYGGHLTHREAVDMIMEVCENSMVYCYDDDICDWISRFIMTNNCNEPNFLSYLPTHLQVFYAEEYM